MRLLLALFSIFSILLAKEQTIYLGAGCFWGVEKHFEALKGVKDVEVGYANGEYKNPTYHKVLAHRFNNKIKNYTESIKVTYDDSVISTKDILKEFWQIHNPTLKNRQGNDLGNNYKSAIFYTNKEQARLSKETKESYQKLLNKAGYGKITTTIEPLKSYTKAEEYHQDYLKKHPNGYCPNHSTGIKFKNSKVIKPLNGKEIIVIESNNCPFCKAFKEEVLSSYQGNLPLRVAKESELEGFKLNGEIKATPTTLFIKDGKEVARRVGFMDKNSFYKALGEFKLKKESLAYKIAFNRGTESRFCKRYDKFKDVKDGVFVDILSGKPLFDTKDRFNSHSGWLSFYRAINDSITTKEDNRFGMKRVEVIAKESGIHLGHVFDLPNGKKRFCINANVLEFIPRDKIKKQK